MTKLCRTCGQELPIRSFYAKKDNADGLHTMCKDCMRAKGGHTKRQPPAIPAVDDEAIDVIEAKLKPQPTRSTLRERLKQKNGQTTDDREYASIVAEAIANGEKPSLQKSRIVRNNTAAISQEPVLNFDQGPWNATMENRADQIYEAWEKRQKQNEERFSEISERCPVLTKHKTRRMSEAETYSYDRLIDELGEDFFF